jgi:ribosomal protein S18 acetylase RimI-like enzyme
MSIIVRRASPDDAAAIAAVEVRSWRAAYRDLMPEAYLSALSEADKTNNWRDNLAKHGAAGRKRVCVAVRDGDVCGFVRVGPDPDPGDVGHLYLMYVLPEYWSRGVGLMLMGAGMSELRDLGMREAFLWVLRGNVRARRFYERQGWTQDGRVARDDYGGVSLQAVCYRRAVTP